MLIGVSGQLLAFASAFLIDLTSGVFSPSLAAPAALRMPGAAVGCTFDRSKKRLLVVRDTFGSPHSESWSLSGPTAPGVTRPDPADLPEKTREKDPSKQVDLGERSANELAKLRPWADKHHLQLSEENGKTRLRVKDDASSPDRERLLRVEPRGGLIALLDNPSESHRGPSPAAGELTLFTISTGATTALRVWKTSTSHYSNVPMGTLSVELSPRGDRVIVNNFYPQDRNLLTESRLYATPPGKMLAELGGTFSPRGTWIISDSTIIDASTGKFHSLIPPRDFLNQTDWLEDESLVLSGCTVYTPEGEAFAWPLRTSVRTEQMLFTRSDALLALRSDGLLWLDTARGTWRRIFGDTVPKGARLALDETERLAAVSTEKHTLVVDMEQGKLLQTIAKSATSKPSQGDPQPAQPAFGPGNRLAIPSETSIQILPLGGKEGERTIPFQGKLVAMGWSREGHLIIATRETQQRWRVAIHESAAATPTRTIHLPRDPVADDLGAIAFRPESTEFSLVFTATTGTLFVLDAQSGKELATTTLAPLARPELAWSSGGDLVVGTPQGAQVWDARLRKQKTPGGLVRDRTRLGEKVFPSSQRYLHWVRNWSRSHDGSFAAQSNDGMISIERLQDTRTIALGTFAVSGQEELVTVANDGTFEGPEASPLYRQNTNQLASKEERIAAQKQGILRDFFQPKTPSQSP